MTNEVQAASLADIQAARTRLAGLAITSPVVAFEGGPAGKDIRLKLENLQPVGSFKVRPVGAAMLGREPGALAGGVYTFSTGNGAATVAWMARRLGVPATAVVPVSAPAIKLERLAALGAQIVKLPDADWWRAIETGEHGGLQGLYIDIVRDPAAIAGDGIIGLEILEQAPEVEAILLPFGGGGLACGVACAIRALRPQVKIIACELDTAAPLTAARAAGRPVAIANDAGFLSGVGLSVVLPELWPLLSEVVDETILVSRAEVADAIRRMAEQNRVIAEGAGAVSVAAALSGRYEAKRVCAVVSGGNLGGGMLATILGGGVP
jgi:threonine dehydratase